MQLIQAVNELDAELYRWVEDRFDEEIRGREAEVARNIRNLRAASRIYRPVRGVLERVKEGIRARQG
jgi:hypothetical protein